MEAIKLLQKNDQFITNNIGKTKSKIPLTWLSHQAKQFLTVMSNY